MKWKQIIKLKSSQPKNGTYKQWKDILAKEGDNQCVYCAIKDGPLGGIRNFHVEHYKPKAIFPKLENVFSNLFYACPICNSFKGDDWPRNPRSNHSVISYPNPSKVDYCTLFDIDGSLMVVRGKTVASRYLIAKLHLNRTQLILARREHFAGEKIDEVYKASMNLIDLLSKDRTEKGRALLVKLSKSMGDFMKLHKDLQRHTPYTSAQTR